MSLKTSRKIVLILIISLASMVLLPSAALADSNGGQTVLVDLYDYFTAAEREAIEANARKLPESYRYMIMPVVEEDFNIKGDARKIFTNRGFSQDTIFMLIYSGAHEIYITTGDSLKQKKLDDEFFEQELETYFIPIVVAGGTVAQALIELTNAISRDIPGRIDTGKNEITIPEPPVCTDPVTPCEDAKKFESWVALASLIALALIILLTGIIIFNRKRSNAE